MKCDVLTIGTGTRDIFLRSSLFKIVRDPVHLEKLGFKTGEAQCFALGGKVEVDSLISTIGGGAINAAVTFARQGFKTATVFKVGDDRDGKAVIDDVRQESIIPFAILDKKKHTASSVILLSPSGERTILNYRGASGDLTLRDVPLQKISERVLYLTPGSISFPVVLRIVRSAKRRGTFVAMDPSKDYLDLGLKRLAPLLRELDLVHVNREEASYLARCRYEDEKKIFNTFDKVVPGLAVMTDGANGVTVSDGKRIFRAGIYKEKRVVDRTGAGDAFTSGFVAGLMQKSKRLTSFSADVIRYALRLGSANAMSVVEQIGAQEGILKKGKLEKSLRFRSFSIRESSAV